MKEDLAAWAEAHLDEQVDTTEALELFSKGQPWAIGRGPQPWLDAKLVSCLRKAGTLTGERILRLLGWDEAERAASRDRHERQVAAWQARQPKGADREPNGSRRDKEGWFAS